MQQLRKQIRNQTMIALMAAIIFIITWTLKVPLPFLSGGGYVNLGDVCIYLCAYLLGGPRAALAAAIGSGAADLAAGAAVYMVPTIFIKGTMGFVAGVLMKGQRFRSYLAGCAAGGAIMVCGYALFEMFMWDKAYAIAALPFNCLQWAGSFLISAALYALPKRLKYRLEESLSR